jgi:hypothetical protein
MEFKCSHCGEMNDLDLSEFNISELAELSNQPVEDSEEILALKEQIKEQQILVERQQKQLKDTQSGITKAISKTDKPSMEIQGEVAEEVLTDLLEEAFPEDEISSIKKGQSGADVRQVIMTQSGHEAGSILFESKSTKSWSNGWIEKLRSDMQEEGSTVGLLVSKAFPAKQTDLLVQLEERIWLCKPGLHVTAFVRALRQGILMGARREVLDEFASTSSKDTLYEYITGDFVEQISNIARIHSNLNEEIVKEKNAFKRKWTAREKTLDQLVDSMTGIVGSISGIGVPSMKLEKIKELSMD